MDRARQALLLAVVLVSGAAVLVLELAAGRLFAPWFGTSLPVWTNVLAVVLGALAAGYALGGRLAGRGAGFGTTGGILLAAGVLSVAAARIGPPLARSFLPADVDLEGLSGVLVRGSFAATLIVFGPAMVLLGAIGPLAVHLLAEGLEGGGGVMPGPAARGASGRAAGRVLALSTLGSIAGTFLTTHVLLPDLGVRNTVGAAGCALLLGGGALLLARPPGRVRPLGTAALLAAAGVPLLLPGGPLRPADPGTGRVIAEYDSAYQFLQVREVDLAAADGAAVPTRILTMNEGVLTYHSVLRPGSVLTGGRYYDVYPALPLLLPREPGTPLRVLVLGFAAGTQARALRHFHGADLRLEGVEIDPAALAAGRAHFELPAPSPELRIHAADARSWLAAAPADRVFDLVLVDCYSHEYYVPFHVATREFFAAVRERLAPGGILAFNAFAYAPDDPLLRTLSRTAAAAFGSAWVAPVEGYPNWVVLASRREGDLPLLSFAEAADRAARAPAAAPPRWGGFAGRPEAAEVLRTAAACLGAAVPVRADPSHAILTDDRAPVERLTDRAVAEYDRARTEIR